MEEVNIVGVGLFNGFMHYIYEIELQSSGYFFHVFWGIQSCMNRRREYMLGISLISLKT